MRILVAALRGIYRKLGVNQRRDAVLAARRLGLIRTLRRDWPLGSPEHEHHT